MKHLYLIWWTWSAPALLIRMWTNQWVWIKVTATASPDRNRKSTTKAGRLSIVSWTWVHLPINTICLLIQIIIYTKCNMIRVCINKISSTELARYWWNHTGLSNVVPRDPGMACSDLSTSRTTCSHRGWPCPSNDWPSPNKPSQPKQ